ncbi:DUF6778 family protein [Primorskyibacter sp. S87]|uniref:DUF6778 family protein n=1 Tax=Primorskyibacter sp. S87 TaxID=3415126 RepID=UPI003C7A1B85
MKTLRMILLTGLGLSVSACAAVDVPTRNAPYENLPDNSVAVTAPAGYELTKPAPTVTRAAVSGQLAIPGSEPGKPAQSGKRLQLTPGEAPVTVKNVSVTVPRSLKVSERNSYIPRGDIVWREDPIGDRHAQVQKIVLDAMKRGVAPMHGPVPVNLEIQVVKFHALTEKARYTTGGVHALTFDLVLKDPKSGQLVVPARRVRADLDAFGGQQALEAEARGLTQKVRITNHLAEVIRQELTSPEGYENASLGIIQMMNQM